MPWVLGAGVIVLCGAILYRLLCVEREGVRRPPGGLFPLGDEREAVYSPVASEIETQSAILGISLNDAFEERKAGRDDTAWHLVRLSASEWDRLWDILAALFTALTKHFPDLEPAVPVHPFSTQHFRSNLMIDFLRMHELLDRIVFRSKLRFQLQLRVLRRAAETLTFEFRRSYRHADRLEDHPPELWERFDVYYHDYDLVTKQALLAFRIFLFCLPHPGLGELAAELERVLRRGVRSVVLSADEGIEI